MSKECYTETMETIQAPDLKQIDERLARVEASVERVRRFLFWGLVLQLGMVLVPLLLIMLAVPFFLTTFGQVYEGLL